MCGKIISEPWLSRRRGGRLGHEDGFKVLRGMQVHPDYQGQGIGGHILSHCVPYLDGTAYCLPYTHLVRFYERINFAVADPRELPPILAARLTFCLATGQPVLAMKRLFSTLLLGVCLATGCAQFPRADVAYRGNGDARILEYMRGNYMSSQAGVAHYLRRHLENGLRPGQTLDKAYLLQRGAICDDGDPVVCTFNGVADEHFAGLPKENAHRSHRVSKIEARIVLLQPAVIDVRKEESYPDAG